MAWFVNHFKTVITLLGSAVIAVGGFAWHFILMGYNTEAKVQSLEKQIAVQQVQITTVDRQTSELIGIMKSVKEDTSTLKTALIGEGLKRKTK